MKTKTTNHKHRTTTTSETEMKTENTKNQIHTTFVKPPTVVQIPLPPDGFVATDGSEYRGLLPKVQQLAVMGDAVDELRQFDDYAQVFGRTAPLLANVTQTFDAANRWSMLRIRTNTWESFCLQQEGLAWKSVRALLDRMQPAFALAVQADPELGNRFPGLARLFSALKSIAKKGVSTKAMNRQLALEGKMPIKGGVGKQRKRRAEVLALKEQLARSNAPAVPTSPPTQQEPPAATPPSPGGGHPAVNAVAPPSGAPS